MPQPRASVADAEPYGAGSPTWEPVPVDVVEADPARDWMSWRNLWQIPTLVVSTILIALGVRIALIGNPASLERELAQAQRAVAAGELDTARTLLRGDLEANVARLRPEARGLYHATVADWIASSQEDQGVWTERRSLNTAEQYGLATAWGMELTPRQLDRWCRAALDLSHLELARERLDDLAEWTRDHAYGQEAKRRRHRLLREVIEASLYRLDPDLDQVGRELEEYRASDDLDGSDLAWVALTRARIGLIQGRAEESVRRLLVEMRRLETEALPDETWGELSAVLGRGYADQGLLPEARFHLLAALDALPTAAESRGDVLYRLGRIDVAFGDHESARRRFDEVVDRFVDTPAFGPALLARAEVASVLGDEQAALADFFELESLLRRGDAGLLVSPGAVAEALLDRCDAAIAFGDLDLASQYVELAETLFAAGGVPAPVLERLASVTRQRADERWPGAIPGHWDPARDVDDPVARRQALDLYERAGDAFLRHARLLQGTPGAENRWASSLRLAGECLDIAGRRSRAIEVLVEYVGDETDPGARSPENDPAWPAVAFRLASAYEAEERFERAVATYQWILDTHPRSPEGTRSHVPLARCLESRGDLDAAEACLLRVVDGSRPDGTNLSPAAPEYREALLALGAFYWKHERLPAAIQWLTAAVERWPDRPETVDVRFQLADALYRMATETRVRVAETPLVEPSRRAEVRAETEAQLRQALELFGEVVATLDGDPELDHGSRARDRHRYAMLYRADCAFDLEEYELAERLYFEMARRYEAHHSSMHALVQIVNCFERLGDDKAAAIAHANARKRLSTLPDDAFDAPDALFDRNAWEEWVRRRPFAAAAAAGSD